VPGVEVAGQHTTVRLPPRDGGSVLGCPNGQSDRCIFGDVSYRLPDVWIAGATWRLGPGLELSAMVRWIWLSMHDKIDIRLSGPTLDANGRNVPQHVVLWRGFQDVWDARARVSYWWRERVRIGAMLRIETSAVDTAAVNAAAVDGFKLQPVGLIEVRVLRQLWIGGGYGITFMRAVDVADSVFKPDLAPACVNGRWTRRRAPAGAWRFCLQGAPERPGTSDRGRTLHGADARLRRDDDLEVLMTSMSITSTLLLTLASGLPGWRAPPRAGAPAAAPPPRVVRARPGAGRSRGPWRRRPGWSRSRARRWAR
jgi:hypothetical protein